MTIVFELFYCRNAFPPVGMSILVDYLKCFCINILPSERLQMKVFGDGCDYGGRHSVFVAMSFLNNEIYLNNLSYQSPKEMLLTKKRRESAKMAKPQI